MTFKPNHYIKKIDYCELHIYSPKYGEFILYIDNEDIKKAKSFHWGIEFDGNNWYARNRHANLKLHRYLVDCPKGLVVDHIDRNTLNNRKNNLRICTAADNNRNRPLTVNYPHSTSEYGIGLWQCKNKASGKVYSYFKVQIFGFKTKVFKDIDDAIDYRDELLKQKELIKNASRL